MNKSLAVAGASVVVLTILFVVLMVEDSRITQRAADKVTTATVPCVMQAPLLEYTPTLHTMRF